MCTQNVGMKNITAWNNNFFCFEKMATFMSSLGTILTFPKFLPKLRGMKRQYGLGRKTVNKQ